MRTSNSIKNSITSFICYTFSIFIGFFTQSLIIKILGAEYLGINGLFSNILSMLSIFELGIGNAIIYNLYKPVANDDTETIKSLMNFYRKAYNVIALLILIVGLLITPFLGLIVEDVSSEINIYAIFILFLLQTVSSYILTSKRSILYAYQKNYIINLIHLAYLIIINVSKLVLLYITKDYYLYLGIMIIGQLLENIFISIYANKLFPFLKEKNIQKLDNKIYSNIFTKVRALIIHKIGAIIVLGSDNLIISKFLGVITVGLYSNYSLIINYVSNLFSQIITSTTSSVGNLVSTNSRDFDKLFSVFKKIRFLNFWTACFASTCVLVIMQPFIVIWVGKKYLLSDFVLAILVFNLFQKIMRNSYTAFKDSAGIWVEDRFVPIIESVLNIVFSIVLIKPFGLAGVFMGTVISGLALWFYSYPKFVYMGLFNRKYINYLAETIGYILTFIMISYFTYKISLLCVISNLFLKLIVNIIIAIIVPNLIMIFLFWKNENFHYYIYLIKSILKKVLKNPINKL